MQKAQKRLSVGNTVEVADNPSEQSITVTPAKGKAPKAPEKGEEVSEEVKAIQAELSPYTVRLKDNPLKPTKKALTALEKGLEVASANPSTGTLKALLPLAVDCFKSCKELETGTKGKATERYIGNLAEEGGNLARFIRVKYAEGRIRLVNPVIDGVHTKDNKGLVLLNTKSRDIVGEVEVFTLYVGALFTV